MCCCLLGKASPSHATLRSSGSMSPLLSPMMSVWCPVEVSVCLQWGRKLVPAVGVVE